MKCAAMCVPAHREKMRIAVLVAGTATLLAACAAPFSDLQSARLAGPDHIEATPAYSAVFFSAADDTERVQNHFGFQAATGISSRTDLRIRYERIAFYDSDAAVNVLGLGPKFGLLPDRVALYVPVGFAFGSDIETSDTFQVHPTLLLTLQVHQFAEVNGSVKALIPITERDIDDLVAFNVGLGLGPDLRRWAVRPEVGFLFNPGEEGHFRHFSIGLTYYFDRP
jgi:hypothetical protein